MLKKQKEVRGQASSPSLSQAPTLSPKKSLKQKSTPPFPAQKKGSSKPGQSPDESGFLKIGLSSVDDETRLIDPRDVKTAGAALDIPFRAVNLIWKDVPALTKEEIEYMAEPLAEILIELDWMDKLKGPYLKLGWGLSIAVVSRVRAHELVKAERKKDLGKKGSQDRAGGAIPDGAGTDDGGKGGSTMTSGRK